MKRILLTLTVLSFSLFTFAQDNLWLRYPAISPDGQTILFNYKGDIYTVPVDGGKATPLTISDSYEYSAVWSNDGKQIAFASDRFGNFDIYIMPAEGGESTRLTFHSTNEKPSSFTSDDQSVVFTALRQDLHTHVQFPTGSMAELYKVPVTGGRVDQILTTPAHDATFNSSGNKLIFHDRKGYENPWRKHHTSAVTRDVWVYDLEEESYQMLSTFNGEDRNPVFHNDDNTFYYLSEENGSFNVHQSSLENPGSNTAITSFTKHPVRFLSISDNNTLCFSFDGKIYTMDPGGEPQQVPVSIGLDGRNTLEKVVSVNRRFTEASLSPNGKEFAYVFRGEIFVSSIENGTTKRITNTPWQERSVSFSPDGRSLVYAAEVDNSWNVYTTSIQREEEPYFYLSTLLDEKTVIATDKEEFQPSYSPDGKEIAYLEDRKVLKVINLESKETRLIMPAEYNYSYSDGDQWYQWSPDSKWFLVSFGAPNRIFFEEIGLVEASGSGEIRNLTQSGYSDVLPKWSMEGKMMIWGSSREGGRSEQGWISTRDVYGLYFDKETFDLSKLTKEEFTIHKEAEKDDDKKDDEKGKMKKGKKDKDDEDEKSELISIDWENLAYRKVRLTTHTSSVTDWLLSKDGEKLYYLTRFEGSNDLWETELRTHETKKLASTGGRQTSMELSKEGDFLFVLADGNVMTIGTSDGKVKRINTNGEMLLKQDEERAYIFDHSWRQLREKFYVEDLQGVDWDFYYSEYKKFLPHISNNYDFAEMLSEMLGEMNASHTGSGYRPDFDNPDRTSSLGVLYDYNHSGNGLKIAEILVTGPLDKAVLKVRAGHIIEKIDGEVLSEEVDFYK
jgi:Tol biopolymer transport system component